MSSRNKLCTDGETSALFRSRYENLRGVRVGTRFCGEVSRSRLIYTLALPQPSAGHEGSTAPQSSLLGLTAWVGGTGYMSFLQPNCTTSTINCRAQFRQASRRNHCTFRHYFPITTVSSILQDEHSAVCGEGDP